MCSSRSIAAVLVAAFMVVAACTSPTKPTAEAPPLPPVPGPEGFITSDLILPDMEESPGDVNIGVTVTNTGTSEMTKALNLVIDGKVVSTKQVTLAGGASENVTFSTVLAHAGTHTVVIDQVTGKLDWMGPN